jgi:hypothetical protein
LISRFLRKVKERLPEESAARDLLSARNAEPLFSFL